MEVEVICTCKRHFAKRVMANSNKEQKYFLIVVRELLMKKALSHSLRHLTITEKIITVVGGIEVNSPARVPQISENSEHL